MLTRAEYDRMADHGFVDGLDGPEYQEHVERGVVEPPDGFHTYQCNTCSKIYVIPSGPPDALSNHLCPGQEAHVGVTHSFSRITAEEEVK